jgi:hypothetical protein
MASLAAQVRALALWRASAATVALGSCAFGGTLLLLVVLAVVDGNWDAWEPATCVGDLPYGCFCERPRKNTLVRQPANTFSNLAFSLTGALVLLEAVQQQVHRAKRARAPSAEQRLGEAFTCIFAVANLLLGIGSGLFHASLTLHGQWVDNVGMYLLVSAPLLYAGASVRLARGGDAGSAVARYVAQYLSLNAFLGWLVLAVPQTRRYVFAALIIVTIAAELRARALLPDRARVADSRSLLAATATFALAFFVWNLDIKGYICYRDSLLQGHAFWHLADGIASFMLYLYYHPLAFSPVPVMVLPRGADATPSCRIV